MSNLFAQVLPLPHPPRALLRALTLWVTNNKTFIDTCNIRGDHAEHLYSIGFTELESWLRTNILDGHWSVNVFTRDSITHIDQRTSTRLSYYLTPGFEGTQTQFIGSDKETILESHTFTAHEWVLLKTDVWHRVHGLPEGQLRVFLSCRVFGHESEYSPEHLSALPLAGVNLDLLRRFLDHCDNTLPPDVKSQHIPTHLLLTLFNDFTTP